MSWKKSSAFVGSAPPDPASSVTYAGKVYSFQRDTGTGAVTAFRAILGGGGDISSWVAQPVTGLLTYGTPVFYNGVCYLIGSNQVGNLGVNYFSKLDANGNLTTWALSSKDTNINASGNGGGAAVAYNGFMYRLGSTQSTDTTASFAPINSNGTLGTWKALRPLPGDYNHGLAFAYNGFMYMVNGQGTNAGVLGSFQKAKINADGTLNAWTNAGGGAFSVQAGAALVGDNLVLIAGTNSNASTFYSAMYRYQINGDGNLSPGVKISDHPAGLIYAPSIVYNGDKLYSIGHYNSSAAAVGDVYHLHYRPGASGL